VEGAKEIKVRLWDGKELDATPVGNDPDTDIAVIKIEPPEDLFRGASGRLQRPQVGQFAIALEVREDWKDRSPMATSAPWAVDSLNDLRRQGLRFQNLIQTDAAINLGTAAALCAISKVKSSHQRAIVYGANSLGFAIPINTAKDIIPQFGLQTAKLSADFWEWVSMTCTNTRMP